MSRVPCRISMRLRYGSRLGIVSSRQSTTAELRLVDVLLEWTGYPSPPPAVSLRRRWNRTVEAPAMHVDGLSPCRTCALSGLFLEYRYPEVEIDRGPRATGRSTR